MTDIYTAEPGGQEFPWFLIQSDGKGKLVRIEKEAILYIEGALNYLQIHLSTKSYITYLTIGEIAEILPPKQFIRVHKSFIINLEKIVGLEGNMIYMGNHDKVPLGPNYRKPFLDLLQPMLLKSKRAGGH
ncbi:DNA-binding LytR/AlgR family response regulator [Pedobacter sp. AK017]|uniref:LytR/AlgR family response regulator transcription factor n=1 Tax=Pedobacter sp. AK017 TaxID=2723073 RepID=UPI00161D2BEB|nr:LytTR family DNA-binding domain-containing protein [Pedobacter sp. AK017]MBB5441266.1 DNA-binding LytR/AlgR family response regulator [Pedobacter sp. AK017]